MKRVKKYRLVALLLLLSLLSDNPSAVSAKKKSVQEEKYSLNVVTSDLLLDESFTLSVDGVTDEEVSFKSQDNNIVSITSGESNTSCQCNGEAVGRTSVTVKIKEKGFLFFKSTTTQLTCRVTVSPKATSVRCAQKTLRLTAGSKKKLTVIMRPSITTEVPQFVSSDTEVATVSITGNITAKSKGTAIITATIQNGNTSSCRVTVTKNNNKKK